MAQKTYSDEELIELLQEAEEEITHLNSESFDDHPDYPCQATIWKQLGSWTEACQIAGVETGAITKSGILENIERLADSGEVSYCTDFFNHSDTTTSATFYKYFDSWQDAVDEVGANAYMNFTEQSIIDCIKEFEEEYGYISLRKFKKDDKYPSSTPIINIFGSWNDAVEAAGIEPNESDGTGKRIAGQGTSEFGSNWQKQREKALERDDFECRKCSDEGSLHVHHIKPRRTYIESDIFDIEESNRLQNLVTLCASCHREEESGDTDITNGPPEKLKPRIV